MASQSGKPRDPARERSWRRTVAEHARSGLSMAEFCRRRGLKPWTFRWWRRELSRRDHQAATDRGGWAPGPSTDLVLRSTFLPVQVVPDEPASPPETTSVEIVLPDGPTVRVTRGFDPSTLKAVLSVLGARRC